MLSKTLTVLTIFAKSFKFSDRKLQTQTDSAFAVLAVYKSLRGVWQAQNSRQSYL